VSAGNGRPRPTRVMSGARYYDALGELADRIVDAEAELRRAAAKAPTTAGREDTLAAADGLSAERRRLRAIVAREEERRAAAAFSAPPVLRDPVEIGPLAIDPARRRVTVGGEEVRLSNKEYGVLRMLASDPTRVFTKEELLRDVWEAAHGYGSSRTLDSHASRLRRKLNGAPERHFVVNCWGIGYRLVEEMPEVAVG
jgi:DNA-binding response OmpR family regulator